MPGTRHPQMDLSYYLNNSEAMHHAATRLLNWVEQSGVAYVLFHILEQSEQGCDDVIFCTNEWEIFEEASVRKTGNAPGTAYVDIRDNLWLLRTRYKEGPIPDDTNTCWWIISVQEDILTPANDEIVEMMQRRLFGLRNLRLNISG